MKRGFYGVMVLGLLLVLLPAAVAFAGGSGEKGAAGSTAAKIDKPTDVVLWYWSVDIYTKLFAEFTARVNPNITVKILPVEAADYLQKFQSALAAGGDLPDIGDIEYTWRRKMVDLGVYENLQAPPYSLNPNDLLTMSSALTKDTNGNVVMLDIGPSPTVFVYRRDLAKQYLGTDDDVQLEKMLSSWDAFYQKGLEVKQKSGGKVFMMPSVQDLYTITSGQNAAPFVANGKLVIRNVIQKDFAFLEKCLKAGIVDNAAAWSPAWNASYAAGRHIFYFFAPWSGRFVVEPNDKDGSGRWGVMIPPGGPAMWYGSVWGIPKGAKNKLAAWEVLKWELLSIDGAQAYNRAWDNPFTPYKPWYSSPEFKTLAGEKKPFYGNQPIMLKLGQYINNVPIRPLDGYETATQTAIPTGVTMIANGDTAQAAVDAVISDILKNAPDLKE